MISNGSLHGTNTCPNAIRRINEEKPARKEIRHMRHSTTWFLRRRVSRPSLSDPDVPIHGRKNQRPVAAGFHLSVSRDEREREREAAASRGWPRVRGTPP